ncbi:MAG: efflux RND transporter periplasmic adaptor subunit [Thiovulaceae bacterium]|nr:efflux RND transporter periplasmic adaptor subunit [Sulfurimonadaceae bacterium]
MRLSLFISMLATSTFLITGCQTDSKSADQNETVAETTVATVMPHFGNYATQITATASIQPSPDGIVSITAPATGTINKIHVAIGDNVRKNSNLLTIRSADVSDIHSNEVSAKAAYTQAKQTYTMNQELFRLGAITANDLAISLSNLQQAQALQAGLSQKLSYYGASSDQTFNIKTPIDGVVYDIGTHLGEKISTDTGQPLMKIANIHNKVIVATVYEKNLSAFKIGKQVEIKSDNDNKIVHGVVSYISDVLDSDNKTIKVYIKPMDNIDSLPINMFVSVVANVDLKNVFQVPKKSLVFKDGKFIVYIKNNKQFSPLSIQLVNDDPKDDFSLVTGIPQNTPIAQEAIAMEKE